MVAASCVENILEDALCFLKVWSAQCLNRSIVTRAHAQRCLLDGGELGRTDDVLRGAESPRGLDRGAPWKTGELVRVLRAATDRGPRVTRVHALVCVELRESNLYGVFHGEAGGCRTAPTIKEWKYVYHHSSDGAFTRVRARLTLSLSKFGGKTLARSRMKKGLPARGPYLSRRNLRAMTIEWWLCEECDRIRPPLGDWGRRGTHRSRTSWPSLGRCRRA
jgi:hypothetical protein